MSCHYILLTLPLLIISSTQARTIVSSTAAGSGGAPSPSRPSDRCAGPLCAITRHLNVNEEVGKSGGVGSDGAKIRRKRGNSDVIIAEYLAWLQMHRQAMESSSDKVPMYPGCVNVGCGLIDVIDTTMLVNGVAHPTKLNRLYNRLARKGLL